MLDAHEDEVKEAGINVIKVDCTSEDGKAACQDVGITGYPTFQTACGGKRAGAFPRIKEFIDFASTCGSE
tara:strand:+ start:145 stop:354 length:210 start_codon:yes stop_codon:yes gene_type:complete